MASPGSRNSVPIDTSTTRSGPLTARQLLPVPGWAASTMANCSPTATSIGWLASLNTRIGGAVADVAPGSFGSIEVVVDELPASEPLQLPARAMTNPAATATATRRLLVEATARGGPEPVGVMARKYAWPARRPAFVVDPTRWDVTRTCSTIGPPHQP